MSAWRRWRPGAWCALWSVLGTALTGRLTATHHPTLAALLAGLALLLVLLPVARRDPDWPTCHPLVPAALTGFAVAFAPPVPRVSAALFALPALTATILVLRNVRGRCWRDEPFDVVLATTAVVVALFVLAYCLWRSLGFLVMLLAVLLWWQAQREPGPLALIFSPVGLRRERPLLHWAADAPSTRLRVLWALGWWPFLVFPDWRRESLARLIDVYDLADLAREPQPEVPGHRDGSAYTTLVLGEPPVGRRRATRLEGAARAAELAFWLGDHPAGVASADAAFAEADARAAEPTRRLLRHTALIRVMCLAELGRTIEAETELATVDLDPEDADARLLGLCAAARIACARGQDTYLERLRTFPWGNLATGPAALAWRYEAALIQAEAAFRHGELARAEALTGVDGGNYPPTARAALLQARVRLAAGDEPGARTSLNQVLAFAPEGPLRAEAQALLEGLAPPLTAPGTPPGS